MLDGQLNTLHVPVPEPPAHTSRSSFTASLMFILLRQVLTGTMGIVVFFSLLVEKSVVPASPQPWNRRVGESHETDLIDIMNCESNKKGERHKKGLTIDMPLLDFFTFVIIRETGRAEDRKIHTLLWRLVVKIMLFSVILITKFEKGNVIEVACEVLVDNKLADPYFFPDIGCITKSRTQY